MATRRSAFDERRDQHTADDIGIEKHLMCRAKGCPNRWSTDIGHVCSWHYRAAPHQWPQITQEQIDAEADRALAAAAGRAPVQPLSREQKTEILQKLLGIAKSTPSKQWAHVLKARELRGDRLSPAQREMWREAIGERAGSLQQAIE